jgi:hypothetical protein
MLIYPVSPATFLSRHRRFSSVSNEMSQAEIMVYAENGNYTLYFHDIDKVYTTTIVADSEETRIYLMNFVQIVEVLSPPFMPTQTEYITTENKLLQ